MEQLYRVEELSTNGWHMPSPDGYSRLTKEQAKVKIDEIVREGTNPERIRVIREV